MKAWANIAAVGLFVSLNIAASAAYADVNGTARNTNSFAHADIEKVITIVPSDGCGIVDVRMTYLDSHGVQNNLDYTKFASCGNDGG
ncbi:DUF2790 domain-containing protein [Pseudomonas petrae]|uniref:DUF2790 domain-containing protein n=1 Tax=Pseudomonas petrae TaxID=2912190 RepID=UPI001EF0AFEF|nr:DUF2790 domain-containing protein [Pseudomonas petrae]MCF7530985.1 DUF2790 domain-containing protein [Pseudomonas petrae]MCF7536660.1 DUF2790 domain-containing protein [Pseudomonas petrae]MCF7554340.1 DUF2790 domain-containing protein [Pseudomonas petrae]